MQQAIITRQSPAPIGMPVTRRPKVHVPQPAIKLPPRGTTGPVHISKLLNPVLEFADIRTGTGCWQNSSANIEAHRLII